MNILEFDDNVSSFLHREFDKTCDENSNFGRWLNERFHCQLVYRGQEYWPSSLKFKSTQDLAWFVLQLPRK